MSRKGVADKRLIRSGKLPLAAIPARLGAVNVNFIRRHWKRRSREGRVAVQLESLRFVSDGLCSEAVSQTKLFVDRLGSRSRGTDQGLLKLMRLGLSLSEAARKMGDSGRKPAVLLSPAPSRGQPAWRSSRTLYVRS